MMPVTAKVGFSPQFLTTPAMYCRSAWRVGLPVAAYTFDCHHTFVVRLMFPYTFMFVLSSIAPGTPSIPHLSLTPLLIPVLRSSEFFYGVMLCRLTVFYPNLNKAIGGSLLEWLVMAGAVSVLSLAADMQTKALITVLIGILIVQLAGGRGSVTSLLSTKPLLLLGGASYALYLLQGPVRALCDKFIAHPFDRYLSPILTIAAAVAVFLYWEQPSRRKILSAYRGAQRNRH